MTGSKLTLWAAYAVMVAAIAGFVAAVPWQITAIILGAVVLCTALVRIVAEHADH